MTFFKKAFRSIMSNKKTYLACASLIAIGILIYVAMSISSFALEDSMTMYYKNYNMSDVFAKINSAPISISEDLKKIPGVDSAMARLTYDARAEIDGNSKIITLRLISVGNDDELNKYYISHGNEPASESELLLGDDFFMAHDLNPGDSINLIIEGRQYSFNISGAALSPEFVYTLKDESALYPDAVTFGIAFIDYDSLASITNMQGMANDICLTLDEGIVYDNIKIPLEDSLDKYGRGSIIERKDQLSHYMLEQEIRSVKSMASALSLVFVTASMIVLYLMLKRLIEQDRAQIGTLKAFGYSSSQVLFHYLTYGAVTGVIGGIIGAVLGILSSGGMLDMYSMFFKMPELRSHQSPAIVIQGLIIATAGGVAGSFMGAYSIINLNPAEAMRPKPPKAVKTDILSLLPFLKIFLTSRGSMAVRSIGRSKVRSAFIVMGMTFSFGILAVMNSMNSMMDAFMYDKFEKSQVYDGKITLKVPVDATEALEYAYTLPAVDYAETLLELPVTLKNINIEKTYMITGISPDSTLYKIYDGDKRSYLKPQPGLIISSSAAKKLNAGIGSKLNISSPLMGDDTYAYVSNIVTESIGANIYMQADELAKMLNLNNVATSVIFETNDIVQIREYLKEGKNILTIDDAKDTKKALEDLMGSYTSLLFAMRFMGIFVALAIIYNTSSISLSERKREYATLKVLGLETKEIVEIMSFEYWLLSIGGIALGIPFTNFIKQSLQAMMDVELFSIPMYTEPEAYVIAVFGCSAAVIISNYISKNAIKKFDIVEVLKERE